MFKKRCEKLFNAAGIEINGKNPWGWDMRVHNDRVFRRAILDNNLGLGESYMAGDWDCEGLDQFIYLLLKAGLDNRPSLSSLLPFVMAKLRNAQKFNPWRVAKHYDLGNDLFQVMLDQTMSYSCGYWPIGTTSLEQAQLNKLDLICKKIQLKPGEKVLDIGCGWGGFAKYAAANYGAAVTGLTVSKEQAELARQRCQGLPVEILLQDYREFTGQFDKIVSVGMFEHVGPKNYRAYMRVVDQCLKDDGLFLLHTIGGLNNSVGADPWIEKYIFPNGVIPSLNQILTAAAGIFKKLDGHEFGACYDQTLMAWWQNFNAAWPELSKNNSKYDESFYRMWKYYLLSCAGAFRAGKLKLWQIVFAKKGAGTINYTPIR